MRPPASRVPRRRPPIGCTQLVLVLLLLVPAGAGAESPKRCDRLAAALDPGGEEAPVAPGTWVIGLVSARAHTLEVLYLRKSDGAPLALYIRARPRAQEEAHARPYTLEGRWRGPEPEPAEVAALVSWARERLAEVPLAARHAFVTTKHLPSGTACNAERPEGAEAAEGEPEAVVSRVRTPLERFVYWADRTRTNESPWLAWLLILALLVSLGAALPSIAAAQPPASPGCWLGLGLVCSVFGALVWLLPDTVLHENWHGYELIRVAAAVEDTPYYPYEPYGFMSVAWARLLGMLAEPGHETFAASRVAMLLAIPGVFLWALSTIESQRAALVAAGLFAAQPVSLYAARAETSTSIGVLLIVLFAWLATLAARRRDLRLLLAAALAGTVLLRFRLLGAVVMPPLALLVLALRPDVELSAAGRRRWRRAVWLLGAAAVALALPHLAVVLPPLFEARHSEFEWHYFPSLLDTPYWSSPVITLMAAAGALALLPRRPRMVALLVAALLFTYVASLPAANTWAGCARYQAWAAAAVALLAAAAVEAVIARAGRLAPAAALLLVLLPALGSGTAAATLAVEHPESAQLHVFRRAVKSLEPHAVLAAPVGIARGANLQIPDAELMAARPDVLLVDLRDVVAGLPTGARPVYYFDPLPCSIAGGPYGPCTGREALALRPVWTEGVSHELPPDLNPRGDYGSWWNHERGYHDYPPGPAVIGLYRVLEVRR